MTSSRLSRKSPTSRLYYIVTAAKRMGYCLVTLKLSLATYRLPRSVGIEGNYSLIIIATMGFTAGSGFATTELKLLLLEVVTDIQAAWPLVVITLFVDDLTIEATHESSAMVTYAVSGATDQAIKHFEQKLQLGTSAKKSGSVGSSMEMARRVVKNTKLKRLNTWKSTKLLGTRAGGGRRRCTTALSVRPPAFKKRISRIQILRKKGFRATAIARTAGIPMITYGVDTIGMANTHLLNARRAIVKAVAPQATGKCEDLILHVADSNGGTLDPAVGAHVQPLKSLALCWWEGWQTSSSIEKAIRNTQNQVLTEDGSII